VKLARVYGELGFRVVPIHDVTSGQCSCLPRHDGQPCNSQGKHPRPKNWTAEATSDAAQIAEWMRRYPNGNIGLASGAEFIALDVDPKNQGDATLAALVEIHGDLPETPEQTTGSGGKHFLFQPIAGIGNKASTLRDERGEKMKGLDIRGEGGQIVVAPSESLAGRYEWVRGREPWSIDLAPAPQWLVDALKRPAVAGPSRIGASSEDRGFWSAATPEELEGAELALELHGPAVQGSGGDAHTFRAAALLTHDFALTEEEAWPLLWLWNKSCDPPWSDEELALKLRNGAEYGQGEYGARRSLSAVETARKLCNDFATSDRNEARQWELIDRCRKLAKICGDPAKRGAIQRELMGATGMGATELALPKTKLLAESAKPQGAIEVTTELHTVADAALTAIAPRVFARNGVLCEVVTGQSTFIHDLAPARIQDLMSASAKWVRNDDKGVVSQAAPLNVATILHARREHSGVRVLEAVTTAPVFLADGSLLTERGYNEPSRLFLEPALNVDVPESPTLAAAKHAVVVLRDLVCDYNFAEDADFSAWLAGVLSPLVRSAIGNAPAPMFLVTASNRGAGKTKLAQLAAIIATGGKVGVGTYSPKDPSEWGKKLTAYVRGAEPVVILDNLPAEIGDEALDRLLTSSTWKDRVLGVSEAPPMPIVSTFWGTGNNTEARSDTVRRVLPIRLEVKTERPEDRDDFVRSELEPFAQEYAATYLGAALTILRAWHCAGRPRLQLPVFASYETWSSVVRQALVWAGCADPFLTQARAAAVLHEPENAAHDFWMQVVGSCDGTPAAVATAANTKGASEVLGAREQLTAHTLHRWIGRFVDRPRTRRKIRRHADPLRYTVEAIR
jgi:hypothetical protein